MTTQEIVIAATAAAKLLKGIEGTQIVFGLLTSDQIRELAAATGCEVRAQGTLFVEGPTVIESSWGEIEGVRIHGLSSHPATAADAGLEWSRYATDEQMSAGEIGEVLGICPRCGEEPISRDGLCSGCAAAIADHAA